MSLSAPSRDRRRITALASPVMLVEAGGAHQINGAVDGGMGAGLKEQQLRRAKAQYLDGVTGCARPGVSS